MIARKERNWRERDAYCESLESCLSGRTLSVSSYGKEIHRRRMPRLFRIPCGPAIPGHPPAPTLVSLSSALRGVVHQSLLLNYHNLERLLWLLYVVPGSDHLQSENHSFCVSWNPSSVCESTQDQGNRKIVVADDVLAPPLSLHDHRATFLVDSKNWNDRRIGSE